MRAHDGIPRRPRLTGSAPHRQRGLSLVELMVAITIGALLLGGAVSLFISNKVTYQVTNDLSRLQENARFALEMMVRDIRMAGHFGCVNDLSKVTSNISPAPAAGSLWDVSSPLEGVNNAVATDTWYPSGRNIDTSGLGSAGDLAAGTDAITIRYARGTGEPLTGGSNTLIDVDDVSDFVVNDIAVVSDCGAADVFTITGVSTSNTQITPNNLTRSYEPDTNPTVSSYYGVRYYVGNNGITDSDGTPHRSLYRGQPVLVGGTTLTEQPQELIDGVEQMQLLYGIDADQDGAPDSYVRAGSGALDEAAEWRTVVAVRVAMLLRTVDEYGNIEDERTYQLDDETAISPADNRQRRLFTVTAVVRNLQ